MKINPNDLEQLYEEFKAADAEFQRQLVRVYGEKNAGDARYMPDHDDENVRKAKAGFIAASSRWRKSFNTERL